MSGTVPLLHFIIRCNTGINKVMEMGLGFQMQRVLGIAFKAFSALKFGIQRIVVAIEALADLQMQ